MREFPQQLKKQFQAPNMIRELRKQLRLPIPPSKKIMDLAVRPYLPSRNK